MFEIIRTHFLSIKRNTLFEAKLITKILTTLTFIFFLINLFVISLYIDKILVVTNPKIAPLDIFSRYCFYLILLDIIIKYFYKSYKHIDITPYLTLPIKKNLIYTFLFIKEMCSKWNFIGVALLSPFFFKTLYPDKGLISTLLLIAIVYLFSMTISLFIRYIDILTTQKAFFYNFLAPLLFICIGFIAYYNSISTNIVLNINLLFPKYELLLFLGTAFLFSTLYYVFLKLSKYEIYSLIIGKSKYKFSFQFFLFESFGVNGEIVKLCIKELLRSQLKRNILISLVMLINFLYFYKIDEASYYLRTLFTMLPTLMIGSTLGEFTYIAESTFFDKLMILPKRTPYLILIGKYVICILFATLFSISFIVIYHDKIPIMYWLSVFFFECGVLNFFIFQNAVYNKQRFDILGPLRKVADIKIYSILTTGLIIPSLGIVFLVNLLTSEITANYLMLGTGIFFTFTSPLWLQNIYIRFMSRRYQNMNSFRKY